MTFEFTEGGASQMPSRLASSVGISILRKPGISRFTAISIPTPGFANVTWETRKKPSVRRLTARIIRFFVLSAAMSLPYRRLRTFLAHLQIMV